MLEWTEFKYYITVTNESLHNIFVNIEDILPDGLIVLKYTYEHKSKIGEGSISSGRMNLDTNIESGEMLLITIDVIAGELPDGISEKEIKNKATITATGLHPFETNEVVHTIIKN